MNASSDAAEQIVRLSLESFEVAVRITGHGAKDVSALLLAIMKDKRKTSGKTKLTNMLKTGKELRVFSIKRDDFEIFTREAKRYGILYSSLIPKKSKMDNGTVDIMVRAEDASKINHIVEKFQLFTYDETKIRTEIEKTKELSNKVKGEKKSINPHLGKTEKSPQSKPSLEKQKISDQGTKIKDKPSVKVKLDKAKKEIKSIEKSKNKSEIAKKTTKKEKSRKTR